MKHWKALLSYAMLFGIADQLAEQVTNLEKTRAAGDKEEDFVQAAHSPTDASAVPVYRRTYPD